MHVMRCQVVRGLVSSIALLFFILVPLKASGASRKAAAASPDALYQSALSLIMSNSLPDYDGAIAQLELIRKSKEPHANAMLLLGYLYANGMDTKKGERDALACYQLAAGMGSAEAQYALGAAEEKSLEAQITGKALPDITNTAAFKRMAANVVSYYTSAANQNHTLAQFRLANFYELRILDYNQAYRWYEKAAEGGHTGAQFKLGQFNYLSRNENRNQNLVLASKWYFIASLQNHPGAQKSLKDVFSDPTKHADLTNGVAAAMDYLRIKTPSLLPLINLTNPLVILK